jgi:hypothetical protein
MNMKPNNSGCADLSQLDDNFRSAELDDSRGEFEAVPDGNYQVSIEKAELKTSSAGNPMLSLALRIVGPRCANRLLWRNIVFTAKSIKYAKRDLYTCGLALANLSDLRGRLADLLDVRLEVTKRTKGDNANIYFNRRIEGNRRRDVGDALVPF